jgi:hypothetical protein
MARSGLIEKCVTPLAGHVREGLTPSVAMSSNRTDDQPIVLHLQLDLVLDSTRLESRLRDPNAPGIADAYDGGLDGITL